MTTPGSWDDVERRLSDMESDLYNHGNGLLVRFERYESKWDERRAQEDKREAEKLLQFQALTASVEGIKNDKLKRDGVEDGKSAVKAEKAELDKRTSDNKLVHATIALAVLTAILAVVGVGTFWLDLQVKKGELNFPNSFCS